MSVYGPQERPEPVAAWSPPVKMPVVLKVFPLTHEAISTSAAVPLSGTREEVSRCVSSDFEAWWSLTRGFDQLTHMLVISSSVKMLNGIQRTTSDLRPATSFHIILVKMGTSLQDWSVCCDSDSK